MNLGWTHGGMISVAENRSIPSKCSDGESYDLSQLCLLTLVCFDLRQGTEYKVRANLPQVERYSQERPLIQNY